MGCGASMRWAVRHDGPRALAAAHYALERSLPGDDCIAVYFFMDDAGPFRSRLEPIVLDASSRLAARHRIAERPSPVRDVRAPKPVEGRASVLVVDETRELARVAALAFGTESERAHVRNANAACELLVRRQFDVAVSSLQEAYGERGLVALLQRTRPLLASEVVVAVPAGAESLARARRTELGCECVHLHAPVTPSSLRLVADGPSALRACSRRAAPFPPPPRRQRRERRVLVIDDHPVDIDADFTLVAVRDGAAAVARIEEPWDLVVCSFTMRLGAEKVHAALWRAQPSLKRRFALLVDNADPMQPRTIGRPLSRLSVQSLLDRIDFLPH